jgi:hypothetical protein
MSEEIALDPSTVVNALEAPAESVIVPDQGPPKVQLLSSPEPKASSEPSDGEVAGCPGGCFAVA